MQALFMVALALTANAADQGKWQGVMDALPYPAAADGLFEAADGGRCAVQWLGDGFAWAYQQSGIPATVERIANHLESDPLAKHLETVAARCGEEAALWFRIANAACGTGDDLLETIADTTLQWSRLRFPLEFQDSLAG